MKPEIKRPRDPMALAKLVGDIATGQVVDDASNTAPAKKDYSEFDAAILMQIQAGVVTFTRLCTVLREKAIPYCQSARNPDATYRVIDRRLQALRKAGKIAYTSAKAWRLTV